ncbi:hypothetical protein [Paenibacillus sp. FSL K6-2859]|uniref:hypothetical protein n=1 Tax=Paenibacillus sp. FSL K6-2859 TaxID=2921482 RepID=UPI0030FB8B83
MWPFKRKKSVPCCDHGWRLIDTFIREIDTDPYSLDYDMERVPFFVVSCALCGKQRTLNETEFAHFRQYFNVKLPEVTTNGTA